MIRWPWKRAEPVLASRQMLLEAIALEDGVKLSEVQRVAKLLEENHADRQRMLRLEPVTLMFKIADAVERHR